MAKPFVVIVFAREGSATSTRYGGFAKRLQAAGGFVDHDVVTVALENLIFTIDEDNNAFVVDAVSGVDLAQADFVYLKSWQSMPDEAAALTTYLYHCGTQFADILATDKGTSKLSTIMKLWSHGLAVPFSVYARKAENLLATTDSLGQKFILKDVDGAKGKLNFLVTHDEARQVMLENPNVRFICQRFVPNNGDFRVGVYFARPGFVIKRISNGDSHLNNTSTGAESQYISLDDADPDLLDLAERSATAAGLQVAGVDIICDQSSGKLFVLEVNQGSQIVTGAHVDKSIAAFNTNFDQTLQMSYKRSMARNQPRQTIGRHVAVKLPEIGVTGAIAKADTGAYSSTLHAEDITEKDGVLSFKVVPTDRLTTINDKPQIVKTRDYVVKRVRSSNGRAEERYKIVTEISVDGYKCDAEVTLSDRSSMKFPLLLGRKFLRSRFAVNVELSPRIKYNADKGKK